jgi:hypothetical protein
LFVCVCVCVGCYRHRRSYHRSNLYPQVVMDLVTIPQQASTLCRLPGCPLEQGSESGRGVSDGLGLFFFFFACLSFRCSLFMAHYCIFFKFTPHKPLVPRELYGPTSPSCLILYLYPPPVIHQQRHFFFFLKLSCF